MANKLYLDNKDHDVAYEPSESEDEYSEEEKEILKEIRQRNKKKPDSKKEVLAFDDNSDEQEDDEGDDDDDDDDIIGDSDIERGDEDDRIPDSKAWGKQRRAYYNTDFVDQDYSAYNEKEEEQAQQEEEEAKSIQLRLAKQLDEDDFMLDVPAGAASADEDEEDSSKKTQDEEVKINLKTDLSGLSEREKQQLFEKDSPEFAGLVSDFQTQLVESQNLLNPIMEFATEKQLNLPIFKFVETRNNLILTYCSNVAIYLLFKGKRIPIKYHPITKRLAQLRKLLIQLQERYENVVRPQLEDLLEKIQSGEEVEILLKPVEKKPSKKLRMMKGYADDVEQGNGEDGEEEVEESFQDHGKGIESSDEEDGADEEDEVGEEGDVAERRGITYQIAKNKGLTAHRKKELRNPRVKHRSKFRKALIRRKGAVRTVRTETQRYGGEMSGIKATVKKGIKIKS